MTENEAQSILNNFNGFDDYEFNLLTPLPLQASFASKSLTLTCGENGSGKSLVNKFLWFGSFFFNNKLIEQSIGENLFGSNGEHLQTIFDGTFDSPEEFNGIFTFISRDPILKTPIGKLTVSIENGKVNLDELVIPASRPMGIPTYLSTKTRLFSSLAMYLELKKSFNLDESSSLNDFLKIKQFFKLYEVFALEKLLENIKSGNINKFLDDNSLELNELLSFDLKRIEYEEKDNILYVVDGDNKKKNIVTLGNGEQSILMMLMSTI